MAGYINVYNLMIGRGEDLQDGRAEEGGEGALVVYCGYRPQASWLWGAWIQSFCSGWSGRGRFEEGFISALETRTS